MIVSTFAIHLALEGIDKINELSDPNYSYDVVDSTPIAIIMSEQISFT